MVNTAVRAFEAGPDATLADKMDTLHLSAYLQGVIQMHEAMAPRGTGYFFKAPNWYSHQTYYVLQKHLKTTTDSMDMPALLHVIAAFRQASPPDPVAPPTKAPPTKKRKGE